MKVVLPSGLGLGDCLRICLRFLMFGQRPVNAGQAEVASFAFANGDDQVRSDVLDGFAVRAAAQHGVRHVVGDDRRSSAVVSLAGSGVETFQSGLADGLAVRFGHRGEEREQDAAGAWRVVDPGQWPGEHLQQDAVCGRWSASAVSSAESRPGASSRRR
jgi:hypothetical protein